MIFFLIYWFRVIEYIYKEENIVINNFFIFRVIYEICKNFIDL